MLHAVVQSDLRDNGHEISVQWFKREESSVFLAYCGGKAQKLLHHRLLQDFEEALEESAYVVTHNRQEARMKLPQLSRSLDYTLKEGKILMSPSDRGAKAELALLSRTS